MNDRELLESAAKAAGIRLHVWGTKGAENFAALDAKTHARWNPLADDGDALRLAVKLGIQVFSPDYPEYHGSGDACAAVRRAIVEAAALMMRSNVEFSGRTRSAGTQG